MDIGKDLAHMAADLTDEDISRTFRVVEEIRLKYAGKPSSESNLEALRDEVLTKLADIGILATLDPTPIFYGEPPTLEILGRVAGHSDHTHGFDHEKKGYEVRKANERGEDWLGQKEPINSRKKKK